MKLVLPAAGTMFCGTFTYPIAVRIARRIFRLRLFSNLVQIARLSKDFVPLVRKPGSSHAPRQLVLSVSYFELLQNRLSQFLRLNLLYVAVLELLLELFHHTEVLPVILSDFHETE